MLQIKDIHKKYVTGELVQTALDGVSLNLRDNEFVAILGPSGSGKTTLLNVIGGLDRYDSGDLVINGISTEKYTDRDWDSYRNHTIGFVFQSYNLSPHQTVLANVELALTISGISRTERRKRAVKALDEAAIAPPEHKNMGKSSMSFLTALALSFNNLWTKKARTLLTAFAGSIGIIGIALIMSLSTGFQKYIDKIQADTLSNYPLTIQSETADMAAVLAGYSTSVQKAEEAEEGMVAEQQMISQMFAQIGSNDLASFKAHLEENYDSIGHTISTVKYSYNVKPRIYSADTQDGVTQVNPATLFNKLTGSSAMSAYMDSDVFQEMIDNRELLESQYDVLRGRWPESYDEMIVVLSGPSEIPDYMAYTVGLKDMDILNEMITQVMSGQEAEPVAEPMEWTYDDLMDLEFRLVAVSDLYSYNAEYRVWEDMSGDEAYMKKLVEQGEELHIVGIVCPKEGVNTATLSTGIAYTSALTEHVIAVASRSQIVQSQLADESIDVFTGAEFNEDSDAELSFQDMISVDGDAISSAFGMNISSDSVMALLQNYLNEVAGSIEVDTTPAQNAFSSALADFSAEMLRQFVAQNADESGTALLYLTDAETLVDHTIWQARMRPSGCRPWQRNIRCRRRRFPRCISL